MNKQNWSAKIADIASYYKWLKIWTEDLLERGKTKSDIDHQEGLINYKKEYRKKIKRTFPEDVDSFNIYDKEDGERWTVVYLLPRTEEETREEFEDYFWHNLARSVRQYEWSPTGLVFTAGLRFAKQTLPNGTLVWRVHERRAMDV